MGFKLGDKVRILPLAVDGGVSEKAVGKIGTITYYSPEYKHFCVLMNYEQKDGLPWAILPDQMEHVVIKGQQLLFDFM